MNGMDFEAYRKLLVKNRSCRIFDQSRKIEQSQLYDLVELTRYCSSGRNAQMLKYKLVNADEECCMVFECLKWAGYLSDWDGPESGQRPVAYLIQCLDQYYGQNCMCDDGIQLEAITTGATAMGLSCCIIKAFNKAKLQDILNLPESMDIQYVVALGYGVEKIVIDDMTADKDADFKYWRDKDSVHHVPKRPLESLII